jgi:hypothetical protein
MWKSAAFTCNRNSAIYSVRLTRLVSLELSRTERLRLPAGWHVTLSYWSFIMMKQGQCLFTFRCVILLCPRRSTHICFSVLIHDRKHRETGTKHKDMQMYVCIHVCVWLYTHTYIQRYIDFKKIYEPPHNSSCQSGVRKQVLYWWPTNIRRQHTKFCAPNVYM